MRTSSIVRPFRKFVGLVFVVIIFLELVLLAAAFVYPFESEYFNVGFFEDLYTLIPGNRLVLDAIIFILMCIMLIILSIKSISMVIRFSSPPMSYNTFKLKKSKKPYAIFLRPFETDKESFVKLIQTLEWHLIRTICKSIPVYAIVNPNRGFSNLGLKRISLNSEFRDIARKIVVRSYKAFDKSWKPSSSGLKILNSTFQKSLKYLSLKGDWETKVSDVTKGAQIVIAHIDRMPASGFLWELNFIISEIELKRLIIVFDCIKDFEIIKKHLAEKVSNKIFSESLSEPSCVVFDQNGNVIYIPLNPAGRKFQFSPLHMEKKRFKTVSEEMKRRVVIYNKSRFRYPIYRIMNSATQWMSA